MLACDPQSILPAYIRNPFVGVPETPHSVAFIVSAHSNKPAQRATRPLKMVNVRRLQLWSCPAGYGCRSYPAKVSDKDQFPPLYVCNCESGSLLSAVTSLENNSDMAPAEAMLRLVLRK